MALSNNDAFLPGLPGHWYVLLKGVACETRCWVAMSGDFYVEFGSVVRGFYVSGLWYLVSYMY